MWHFRAVAAGAIRLQRSPMLELQIWSDIACPWCYVGKRRLEAALAKFPQRDSVRITWRSFELDPGAPAVREPQSYVSRLARKYGTSPQQAEAMIARMVGVARAEGLAFDFERIRPGNTFDAHRLLHLAHAQSKQDALKERLFRAYLCEGEAIGDQTTLARLATEVGLAPDAVHAVLATDQYSSEVRADEAAAGRIGVDGVPFFVLANRYAVPGAQPAEVLLSVLTRVAAEQPELQLAAADGDACGPDGCPV